MATVDATHRAIDAVWRIESAKVVAGVARLVRDIGLAEEFAHDALVSALDSKHVAAAGLDVTDPEPLPDGHPLWECENALITPHVANPPSTMERDLAERVRENVRRFAAGEELLAPISPQDGY